MNKKFSTLAAAFLLAGSFSSAFAQTNNAAELKKGNVYYVGGTDNSTFYGGSSTGVATTTDAASLSEAYQWQVVEIDYNGKKQYALKNLETGKYLESVSSLSKTPVYYTFENGQISAVLSNGVTATYYLKEIDPIQSSAAALNNNQGWKKGFALEFKSADHKKVVAAESNVFTAGKITAIPVTTTAADANNNSQNTFTGVEVDEFVSTSGDLCLRETAAGKFLLKVSGDWNGGAFLKIGYDAGSTTPKWVLDGDQLGKFRSSKFIVMDKEVYSNFATNVDGGSAKGYKFITVTGAELINREGHCDWTAENTSVTHHILNAVFDIKQDPTVPTCANDLIISLPNTYVWTKGADEKMTYSTRDTEVAYVGLFEFEGKYYVASTNKEEEAIASHLTLKDNMLAKHKDLTGKIVNIVSDGTSWTAALENVSASYIDGTVPEGQWIVNREVGEGDFSFLNRESDNNLRIEDKQVFTLYKTATANKYEAIYSEGTKKADLVIIEAPARADRFDNYANFDENKLVDQTYNISVVTSLYENVYLAETGLAKTVELTADKAEAGAWKLVKYYSDKDYENGIECTDSIFHTNDIEFWNPNKQGGAGWDNYTDTLAMFAYTIQNEAGKYLAYNAIKKSYEVVDGSALKGSDANFDARKHAPKFIFKEKHGQNNILALNSEYSNFYGDGHEWSEEGDVTKLFGAFSYNKVDIEMNPYNVIDNDLFAIEEVSAPEYRRIAGMDTIKIFKDDNHSDILFEKGSFLGMEHLSDFADMKPAMFADTAYVRYETRKPQYLLVVNPNQVIDKEECEIPNHPHAQADTLYGRFLVNLVDSAKAYAATENKLENPYMWEGGYKLGFRAGMHTADKLFMDGEEEGIDLSQNVNKIGTYAFRYVDRESGSFIIETSLDGSSKAGYIKWLNGTPVVIAERDKAEVFNLAETEEAPTVNEEVEVSEVSVIAANGSVIVKGAANKNVAISSILGRTIANTVVSSDNATIAVPAGIVVVAVEGEEAVKVVVK